MRALDGTKSGYTEKFASETKAGVLTRFSFATAATIQELKNSSKNENAVKSTEFWLSEKMEKVVFREENCRGNRKLQTG